MVQPSAMLLAARHIFLYGQVGICQLFFKIVLFAEGNGNYIVTIIRAFKLKNIHLFYYLMDAGEF